MGNRSETTYGMDLKSELNPACHCSKHASSCSVCLFHFDNAGCHLKIVSKFDF